MKLLRRQAVEDERKHVDTPEGPCPRCGGSGSEGAIIFDKCSTCSGSGEVPRGRAWSESDDALLREHITSATYCGIALRRPVDEIWARISVLGLEKPAPAAFVQVSEIGSDSLWKVTSR